MIEPARNRLVARLSVFLALAVLFIGSPALAQEHGHGALQIFDAEGRANTPQWVMIWIMFMMASFLPGLLFMWTRVEARWVVGGVVVGMAALAGVRTAFNLEEYSGLIALFHVIFWMPAFVILLKRRPFLKERSIYGVWTAVVTGVLAFSLFFDIRDAAIYLDHVAVLGFLS